MAISLHAELVAVARPDPREARRRSALRSIAEGLQRISDGLLALADDDGEDDGEVERPPRRRAWRAPSRPKAPSAADLALVTEDTTRKAELALRKRGLL